MADRGRPRAFDEDAVVAAAMDVFWQNGYSGTSIDDIIDATGLGRQSIYGAFGDKQSLFIRCLREYTQSGQDISHVLAGTGSVLGSFREFLVDALANAARSKGRGCLLGNTVAEMVPGHPAITDVAQHAYADLEETFKSALAHGRITGEIRSDQTLASQATTVLVAMQGLLLVSRAEQDPNRLVDAVDVVLAGLERD